MLIPNSYMLLMVSATSRSAAASASRSTRTRASADSRVQNVGGGISRSTRSW